MRARYAAFFALLKQAALKWNAANCLRLGASLSYYTIFSLFPLILVILAIVQLFLKNSESARAAILDALMRVTGGFRAEFLSAIAYSIALSSYKNYGAVGAILALVAWVYLSSQVLFFGGEFSYVFAQRYGSRRA